MEGRCVQRLACSMCCEGQRKVVVHEVGEQWRQAKMQSLLEVPKEARSDTGTVRRMRTASQLSAQTHARGGVDDLLIEGRQWLSPNLLPVVQPLKHLTTDAHEADIVIDLSNLP